MLGLKCEIMQLLRTVESRTVVKQRPHIGASLPDYFRNSYLDDMVVDYLVEIKSWQKP